MKCYNKDCEYFGFEYNSNCKEIGILHKELCNRFIPEKKSTTDLILVPLSPGQVDRIYQIFKAKAEMSSCYDAQTDYHKETDFFHGILKKNRGNK